MLTLNTGDTQVCLELSFSDDGSLEYNETFEIELEPSSEDIAVVNAVGNQQTVVTIIDDDCKYFVACLLYREHAILCVVVVVVKN